MPIRRNEIITICICVTSLLTPSLVAGQDFELNKKMTLVPDTNQRGRVVQIGELIGANTVAFKIGNNYEIIGKFTFHKDSSIDVENYNPFYPYGYYSIAKGRYIYQESIIVKDGMFIMMNMKPLTDTASVSFYKNGTLNRAVIYFSKNRKEEIVNYKNKLRDGQYLRYDTLGNIIALGEFDQGNYSKVWKYFYTNGQVKAKGKYGVETFMDTLSREDRIERPVFYTYVEKRPVKIGRWYYYTENGVLAYVEVYSSKGNLLAIKTRKSMKRFKSISIDW